MTLTLGMRLRQQRESRELSLAAIADDTKIKQSLLDALERDNVRHWPTGLFRRAYVKSYAKAIGLDPAAVFAEFDALYPDPSVPIPGLEPKPEPAGIRRLLGGFARPRSPALPDAVPEGAPRLTAVTLPVALPDIDFSAVAAVCTRIAQVIEWREIAPILRDAASTLDAVGLTVWSWEAGPGVMRPVCAHGYADATVASLPCVRRDDDNAIAVAFRSGESCVVRGDESSTGALIAPILVPGGCSGVVTVELRDRREQLEPMRAVAMLLAAQFGPLLGAGGLAHAATA